MFSLIILFLRQIGKRGVRQLSIFELTIILSLGSIAGDPMFTKDLPLIQALLIMSTVIFLYRLCTWLTLKHRPFEDFLEGKALYIVGNGLLVMDKIEKREMSHDEVRYGLPLFPKQYQPDQYCERCQCQRWTKAINDQLIR